MPDSTYDMLFESILSQLELKNLDRDVYNVSQIGFLRTIDLINNDIAVRNQELERVCNGICSWSSAYVPNGDLVNSYALFLNYLEKNTFKREVGKISHSDDLNKIALEKKINASIELHRQRIKTDTNSKIKIKHNPSKIKLMSSINPLISRLDDLEKKMGIHQVTKENNVLSLNRAKREVSFLTGARRIDKGNPYNMLASNNGYLDKMYQPAYRIIKFQNEFQKWKKNKENNKTAYHIKIDKNLQNPKDTLPVQFYNYGSGKSRLPKRAHSIRHINVSAQFSGLGCFNVEPEHWFHSQILNCEDYKLTQNAPDFFSMDAPLYSRPISLLLGYNIKVAIHLTPESYDILVPAVTDGNSSDRKMLTVGSQEFCISGSDKNTSITKNEALQSVSIEPFNNGLPSLLGVISQRLSSK